MNITIVGYGKMGQLIHQIATKRNHTVTTIDPNNDQADHKELNAESIKNTGVCIDFTHPSVIMDNLKKYNELQVNAVIGTTGWYDHLDEIRQAVKKSGIGLLYSSNFSIGVNLFFEIVKNAGQLVNQLEEYDIAGIEYHHNKKADSPSGTAKTIANILKDNIKRKNELVYDIVDRQINSNELHFASVRCGSIPGTHKVLFDSGADTIELSHTARNREGFALGAVKAAEWIKSKKGFYDVKDFTNSILSTTK